MLLVEIHTSVFYIKLKLYLLNIFLIVINVKFSPLKVCRALTSLFFCSVSHKYSPILDGMCNFI